MFKMRSTLISWQHCSVQVVAGCCKFAAVREELSSLYADVDLNVLKKAQVVGMTTNGVARSQEDLVAAMSPKVSV